MLSKNNIRVIGFDLDNTLYPSTPQIQERVRGKIYTILANELGIQVEIARDLFEEAYEGNYEWSKSGSRSTAHIAEMYGKVIDRDIVQEAFEQADFLELIQSNPELVQMFNRLSEERELDLITGSAHDMAMFKLARVGINPKIFWHRFCAESGSKTTGEIYQTWIKARERTYHNPENMLYVGDNAKSDILVPKKLGIVTCMLGKPVPEADFNIERILDLEKILD
jgi:FMN phosphatase YigB (HAD superfamily)